MKIISFFLMVSLILAGCVPSNNALEIAQVLSVIEAARAVQDVAQAAQIASQGLSYVGRGQILILVLLVLVLVLLVMTTAYIVIQRLIQIKGPILPISSSRWMGGPDAHWKRIDTHDPYQLLLQQQMLLTQILQQSKAGADEDDPPQLSSDWWE
jgi:hypothetical protein